MVEEASIMYDFISEGNNDDVRLAETVKCLGYPNAYGAKIPLNTKWNLALFEQLLQGYHDQEVIMFLKYGWPANRVPTMPPPTISNVNHKSATDHPNFVKKYINKELQRGMLIGPFKAPPFSGNRTGVSPLSTRPKKHSSERRTIHDLSYPAGAAVNDFTPKNTYMGKPITLSYPNVDMLAKRMYEVGEKCYMWKSDIAFAFKQVGWDPGDYELFGFVWE